MSCLSKKGFWLSGPHFPVLGLTRDKILGRWDWFGVYLVDIKMLAEKLCIVWVSLWVWFIDLEKVLEKGYVVEKVMWWNFVFLRPQNVVLKIWPYNQAKLKFRYTLNSFWRFPNISMLALMLFPQKRKKHKIWEWVNKTSNFTVLIQYCNIIWKKNVKIFTW